MHIPEAEHLVFLKLLVDLRREAGLSQAELAEHLQVPQSFVSKYEAGERRLAFTEVVQICKALRISPRQFVNRFEKSRTKRG